MPRQDASQRSYKEDMFYFWNAFLICFSFLPNQELLWEVGFTVGNSGRTFIIKTKLKMEQR